MVFVVINKMAVSWLLFFCLLYMPFARARVTKHQIVLRSFGSIGLCRDRIDATVCISYHSHPLNYLGVGHQMANFKWMISEVYCHEHVECLKPSCKVPFLTSLK